MALKDSTAPVLKASMAASMANMVAQPWVANTVGHHWEAFTVDLP